MSSSKSTPNDSSEYWKHKYNRASKYYDKTQAVLCTVLFGSWTALASAIEALVATDLSGRDTERILDLGCGTGTIVNTLGRSYPTHSFLGIDFSESMLATAASKTSAHSQVQLILADALNVPFDYGSCDVVIIVAVLHELNGNDRRKLLSEAARILKAGGILVVGEHGAPRKRLNRFLHSAIFRMISCPRERPTYNDLCKSGLTTEISRCGFTITASRYLRFELFQFIKASKLV